MFGLQVGADPRFKIAVLLSHLKSRLGNETFIQKGAQSPLKEGLGGLKLADWKLDPGPDRVKSKRFQQRIINNNGSRRW